MSYARHPFVYMELNNYYCFSMDNLICLMLRVALNQIYRMEPAGLIPYTNMNDIQIDHDMVYVNVNIKPKENKQIPLCRKTNWEGFRSFMEESPSEILKIYRTKSVEEIWLAFKTVLNKGISQFVPIITRSCMSVY